MAKVRNISNDTLRIPSLGLSADPDAVIDVPDEQVESFTCQPATWEEVAGRKKSTDKAASAADDKE